MRGNTLVLGIDSLIGSAFATAVKKTGCRVFGTSKRSNTNLIHLDVTWGLDLWPDFPQCDLLVICASLNKLEQCQINSTYSYAVNVEGLEKAIEKYSSSRTKVLFLSSSHVFGGKKPFCKEGDKLDPQNVLAKHKAFGEEIVLRKGGLVMRVTKVINPHYPRFIEWADNLRTGRPIQAFSNLMASLVPLDALVNVMLTAVQDRRDGIVHISGPEDKSYFDIAIMLAQGLGCSDELVKSIEGESELISKLDTHTTLKLSEWIEALNVELPTTNVVIDRWCKNYLREN